MSNAAKNRKKAIEFEQLKQFDRAIAAYVRAIEDSHEESGDVDVALFNKVGDLTLRQGRVADAVTYYERAVEHYVSAGLYNNAIALCNKILRSAPGRSAVYFTLGRICARKGLRGDATRNFLEYASRMQHEGRVDEGMRALAEVADLMPELTEVRRLVEEHAVRAGITLPQRKVVTPSSVAAQENRKQGAGSDSRSQDLVFLDVDYSATPVPRDLTPPPMPTVMRAAAPPSTPQPASRPASQSMHGNGAGTGRSALKPGERSARLEDLFIFDPTAPGADAAIDENEPSAVDGASLILPSNLSLVDAPDLLNGLETTVVEGAPQVSASDEASRRLAEAAPSLRETPGALVAFEDLAGARVESVLDTSLLDISNLGAVRVVEPTPGLVPAMEFIPSIVVAVEPAEVVEPAELAAAATAAEPDASVGRARDDGAITHEVEATNASEASPVAFGPPALLVEGAGTADVTENVIANAIVNLSENVDERVHDRVDDGADDCVEDSAEDNTDNRIGEPIHQASESVFDTSAEAPVPVAHLDSAPDDIVWLNDLDARAQDAETPTPNLIDEAMLLRDSEIFWLTPTAAVDERDESVGIAGEDAEDTADCNAESVIEFLDVDYTDDTPTIVDELPVDESPVDAPRPETNDAAAHAVDGTDASVPSNASSVSSASESDGIVHDDIASLMSAMYLAAPSEVNDETNDDATLAVEMFPADEPREQEAALPWLEASDVPDLPMSASVATLEGLTVEDEDFAASLPFVSAPEVPAPLPADGLVVDDVEAPVAIGAAAPLDGFVSEDGASDDDLQALAARLTPNSVAVEQPAVADAMSPPQRANQHDFILPGELPLLVLPDQCVLAGLTVKEMAVVDEPDTASLDDAIDAIVAAHSALEAAARDDDGTDDLALDDLGDLFGSTNIPASIAAAEASLVATSKRDELHAAVADAPHDWNLRRRLAHALFEVGERDHALVELERALQGFQREGNLEEASVLADEMVLVDGDRVSFHQKRVELAIRLRDDNRLRVAYLDLADTLVRSGDEAPARAVYVRVLEIDPWDDRARLALGDAAPPPPQTVQPDDEYVDLADWLRDDDEPASTRMRMREPTVSGNEQADFDSLLRHFKEGVARSLGEDDYESHYDLGVAYKEMGLLDDAVAEFQKALRSRTHRLAAYEALGQCFIEQGSYQVADTVLSRALHEPGLGDEQRVGVLYLLGYACEALQRFGEARSYFERVYATDIHFRDVATRLATLDHIAR